MKWQIIFLHIVLIPCIGYSQTPSSFRGGVHIGFTSSQIHGDGFSGFNKAGIIAGFLLEKKIHEKWLIQSELNYVMKGSFDPPNHIIGKNTYTKINLQYVEIPILFNYLYKNWRLGFGVSAGVLTKNHLDEFPISSIEQIILNELKPYEIASVIGIGYQFNNQWIVNFKNSLSLLPVANEAIFNAQFLGLFGGTYNQYLSLQIQYLFHATSGK